MLWFLTLRGKRIRLRSGGFPININDCGYSISYISSIHVKNSFQRQSSLCKAQSGQTSAPGDGSRGRQTVCKPECSPDVLQKCLAPMCLFQLSVWQTTCGRPCLKHGIFKKPEEGCLFFHVFVFVVMVISPSWHYKTLPEWKWV